MVRRGGFKSDSVEPSDIVHVPYLTNKAHGILLLKNQESIHGFFGCWVFASWVAMYLSSICTRSSSWN
jgi:hypothetical protein